MKKRLLVFNFMVIALLLSPASHMAQGGKIHFSKVRILPVITVKGVYDDNIYLENGDNRTTELKEPDWITHIKPSLALAYDFPGNRGGVSFGYRGDYAFYADNDDNNWMFHQGFIDIEYRAPGGIIASISNSFVRTGDPHWSPNEYSLGAPNTERWYDDLKGKIGYDFKNRFRAFGYYNFYVQSYDLARDQPQDYYFHEFGAGFQIRVFPKTWGFLRYHYGWQDYYSHPRATGLTDGNDADHNWHRINTGLTWDSGAKLKGEANVGFQWTGYENERDPGGLRYKDSVTWIAQTSVTFDATTTTALHLDVTRAHRQVAANSKDYYEDTGVRLELKQVFLTDFTLDVVGQYYRHDYELPARRARVDDGFLARIGIDYSILKWLSAGVGYSFHRRNSNYRQWEFTDNQVSVYVTGAY